MASLLAALAALASALVAVVAGPGRAQGDVAADQQRAMERLLSGYQAAWESRNPFEILGLAPEGSPLFVELLDSPRFDLLASTRLRLVEPAITGTDGGRRTVSVSFLKWHEDLFHNGTLSAGWSRVTMTVRQFDDGWRVVEHRVGAPEGDPEAGGHHYLSANPNTWGEHRSRAERFAQQAYQRLGQAEYQEALALVSRAMAAAPEDERAGRLAFIHGNHYFHAQLHWLAAVLHERLGDVDQAAAEARQALAHNAAFPLALNLLADILARQGRLGEALATLQQSLAAWGHQPDVRALIGFFDKAERHYPEPTQREAYLSTRGKLPQEIIETLTGLLEADRRNIETRRALAKAYIENYQPDKAEKVLTENEYLYPDDLETHYLLGRTYVLLRRYDDALAFFKRVWEGSPGYRDTLVFLSELNALQLRHRNAIAYLREGLRRSPGDPEILFKLGSYLLREGQRFEALAVLREARRTRPPLPIRREIHKAFQ